MTRGESSSRSAVPAATLPGVCPSRTNSTCTRVRSMHTGRFIEAANEHECDASSYAFIVTGGGDRESTRFLKRFARKKHVRARNTPFVAMALLLDYNYSEERVRREPCRDPEIMIFKPRRTLCPSGRFFRAKRKERALFCIILSVRTYTERSRLRGGRFDHRIV